jgi:hypothetical protein
VSRFSREKRRFARHETYADGAFPSPTLPNRRAGPHSGLVKRVIAPNWGRRAPIPMEKVPECFQQGKETLRDLTILSPPMRDDVVSYALAILL